jgi:hypothetical protein
MEEVEARINYFWHLMSETTRMILSILYTMICRSRYVWCSKRLRAFIWWSLDNSKDILMYFRRTKNISCMQMWQMVHCNVLHWLCHIYSWNFISILSYLFWVRRWYNKMEESSMMTWMSSNINIVADNETRVKYIIALEAARELGIVPSVLVLCNSIVWQ